MMNEGGVFDLSDQSAERLGAAGKLRSANAVEWFQDLVVRRARQTPEKTALVFEGAQVSYGALSKMILSVQASLAEFGVVAGDRVVSMLENGPEFIATLFACLRAGVVLAPLDLKSSDSEIEGFLNVAKPKLVVVANECDRESARFKGVPVMWAKEAASRDVRDAEAPGRTELQENSPCMIVFTSGSTGVPKGVLLPLRSILHANASLLKASSFTEDDVFLNALPVCHLFSINAGILLPLIAGAKVVVLPCFTPGEALDLVEREKVSVFSGVPTMFRRMVAEQRKRPRDVQSMRTGFIGGAKCGSLEECSRILHCELLGLYGLTEFPVISVADDARAFDAGESGTGRPVDGVSVCFDDAEGRFSSCGMGELICKGPGTMLGYFQDEPRTREMIDVDGWLHTGDLGFLDDKGRLHVSGRKDDVINRGGCKVFPVEVETACLSHPDVVDCCAMGMPHDELGEQIVVFAERKPEGEFLAETLRGYVRGKLSKYKLPDQVILVESLPHLRNGKIDRGALRDLYAASRGTFANDAGRAALAGESRTAR